VSQQPGSPDYPGQPAGYVPPDQPGGYAQPDQPGGYGQPGGYAPPPSGSYPPAAPTPPPRKAGRSRVRLIFTAIIVAAAIVFGIVAFIKSRSEPAATKVGDCMVGQTAKTLKKIDCSDGTAEWKVVGRVADKTEAETTVEDTCTQWPDTEVVYWQGKKGQKGFALCLAPTKK
jgi:hypothetical protein